MTEKECRDYGTGSVYQRDLASAIARIEESRASHQAWAEHLVACSHCAEHGPPPFIQTREEHEQIVREYDGVLSILHSVVCPPASIGGEANAECLLANGTTCPLHGVQHSHLDAGSADPKSCEAIVAEFVFGPQRCGKAAVTEAIDAIWGSIHPVCAEHAPSDIPSSPVSEVPRG